MKLPLLFVCVLLAQPPGELRFRAPAPDQVEVIAPLTPAQQISVRPGKLTAEEGETWLRFCIVDPKTQKPGPPMLGSYERQEAELIFRPRLGVEPGRLYRAFFGLVDGPSTTKDYRPALRNGGAVATVVKVYPTADVLPANHLKFYVYFSQPMRGGQEIFKQIEILDAEGNVVDEPWLTDELWDETGRVLIIYIHPGRIKWGLVLREVLGPVLLPDRDYSFVIRGSMLDANGQKLGKDVVKKFRTTAEDRARVNLGDWKLQAPKASTSGAVAVQFPKSLDHKSLDRYLSVVDGAGNAVAGKTTAGKYEKSWSFTPSQAWTNQEYRLRVNGRLEDVAGNTPLRPFDMDLQAPRAPAQRLEVPFRPQP
jgi:hypothetical protein